MSSFPASGPPHSHRRAQSHLPPQPPRRLRAVPDDPEHHTPSAALASSLVAMALDDLAHSHIDLATALRLVATTAFDEGYRAASEYRGGMADAYIVLITDPDTGETAAHGPFDPIGAIHAMERLRLELDASDLPEFTVALTPLGRP